MNSPIRDRAARSGLTVTWQPRSRVALFGRARAAHTTLGAGGGTDLHLSAGLRLSAQFTLSEATAPFPQRRVCIPIDNGLRLHIPYDGPGTVYATGDFNGWSLPGVPLRPTDEGWQTSLDLPPGRYTYRLRVVTNDEGRWLDLPSHARTTTSAFGGSNGVCTVQYAHDVSPPLYDAVAISPRAECGPGPVGASARPAGTRPGGVFRPVAPRRRRPGRGRPCPA